MPLSHGDKPARHVKKTGVKKLIAISSLAVLLATSFVATFSPSQSPSQASVPDVEYYCGMHSQVFQSDWDGWSGGFNDMGGITLELNSFTSQLSLVEEKDITITFADGEEIQSSLAFIVEDLEPGIDGVTINFSAPITKESEDAWPITLANTFASQEIDISNPEVEFREFETCEVYFDDAQTTSNGDAFDDFGFIEGLGANGFDPIVPSILTQSVSDRTTTFSFTVEDFYSAAAVGLVDISVQVDITGNTFRYSVDAFQPNTSTPAQLTFFIEGNLGSDNQTQSGVSNGHLYTVDDLNGDPVIFYFTDGLSSFGTGSEVDDIRFDFESKTSGYLEVTMFGYTRCASTQDIFQALSDFTSSYETARNSDLAEIEGICIRVCEPTQAQIEVSPGIYDLAGQSLCFDQALNPEDGPMLEQEVLDGPDFGGSMAVGDSIDYQSVIQAADKTLNALLTVTDLYQQDSDRLFRGDRFAYRGNSWINTLSFVNTVAEDRFITYTLAFYEAGDVTKTPVQVSNLKLSVHYLENHRFITADNVLQYSLSRGSVLGASVLGNNRLRVSHERPNTGFYSEESSRVDFALGQASLHTFSLGLARSAPEEYASSFFLDFTGLVPWEQAPVVRPYSRGPVAPKVAEISNYFVVEGFTKGKSKLNGKMRDFIRSEISTLSNEKRVVCTGTVRGKNWTPKKEAIALARAKAGCDYVSNLSPNTPTELRKRLISNLKGNALTVRIRVFY
jgi:hypothetical protein